MQAGRLDYEKTSKISKALRVVSLLPQHPQEFYDRVAAVAAVRWESFRGGRAAYRTVEAADAIRTLGTALDCDWAARLQDPALAEIETSVSEQQAGLPDDAPFGMFHNGDILLARFCYAAARSLRPKVVVETGVCYGVTSAHLLQALDANGAGCLHSIDLPPLGKKANSYVGRFVPGELRSRWTLHRGSSQRLLGPLLTRLGEIDLFVHDSLHTLGTMRREFAAAWLALRGGGVLISDDVNGNAAFLELAQSKNVLLSMVIQERGKQSYFGVAVKRE
ncbi:MAG TPA: class I SAM-dependent methyltransferase [Candidatus Acidoferrum sp.]|nr:class I SAM-dependent methyltransferase [Candidatus Acidoferrum sp.]